MLGYDPIIRDIPDFPNYQISEFGEVYNKTTGRELKSYKNSKSGYIQTGLKTSSKKSYPILIHRVLAIIFIPNPLNFKFVGHIDKNITNNKLENLEWLNYIYTLNDIPDRNHSKSKIIMDIPDFPNYEISDIGEVYNKTTKKEINKTNLMGYLVIRLCKDGRSFSCKLHRILAITFIPNLKNKPVVDHINRIKLDNRLENLRWTTVSENTINVGISKKNISGITGVSNDNDFYWISQITKNNNILRKRYPLTSEGFNDAVKWRKEQELILHTIL